MLESFVYGIYWRVGEVFNFEGVSLKLFLVYVGKIVSRNRVGK